MNNIFVICGLIVLTFGACGANDGRGDAIAVEELGADRPNLGSLVAAIGVGGAPSGADVLSAPVQIRVESHHDDDTNPACFTITGGTPSGSWTTAFTKSFHTLPSTTYIELVWSGQFTVKNGNGQPYNGLLGRATLSWGGESSGSAEFPGLGDTFEPWVARRDNNGVGQQYYTSLNSVIGAPADTDVTVTLEGQAWDTNTTICFQNVILRNN